MFHWFSTEKKKTTSIPKGGKLKFAGSTSEGTKWMRKIDNAHPMGPQKRILTIRQWFQKVQHFNKNFTNRYSHTWDLPLKLPANQVLSELPMFPPVPCHPDDSEP